MKYRHFFRGIAWSFGLIAIGIFSSLQISSSASGIQKSVWNQSFSVEQAQEWIALQYVANGVSAEVPEGYNVFIQTPDTFWKKLQPHPEHGEGAFHFPETPDAFPEEDNWSQILFVDDFERFRFRIEPIVGNSAEAEDDLLKNIPLSFFNTAITGATSSPSVAIIEAQNNTPNIISRAAWGADESLRFIDQDVEYVAVNDRGEDPVVEKTSQRIDGCEELYTLYPDEFDMINVQRTQNGKNLRWPLQYSEQIKKVVIHHTASESHLERDSFEVMRAVYGFHTLSRGWGDIGYNYVIGADGNIFEGRTGGDYVVGGHAYCANVQTIGVALMGNFQVQGPTDAQLEALGELLPFLAQKYTLDLSGESIFHGRVMPNLIGHRDVGSTACPGEIMYGMLSRIRDLLKRSIIIQKLRQVERKAEFTGTVNFLKMKPGAKQNITLQFKNTGNITWSRNTDWLYVVQPPNGASVTSQRPPKSWVAGLLAEATVPPGQVGTFQVEVQAGYEGKISSLEFTPVIDLQKVANASVVQPIETIAPDWGAQFKAVVTEPAVPVVNEPTDTKIFITNIGETEWRKGAVTLRFTTDRKEYTAELEQDVVPPNEMGAFRVVVDASPRSKKQKLRANLYVNDSRMSGVRTMFIPFNIEKPFNEGKIASKPIIKTITNSDGETFVSVKVMNTGTVTWNETDTQLVVKGDQNYSFTMEENIVRPNEIASFTPLVTPVSNGISRYSFLLKHNDVTVDGVKGRWIVRNSRTGTGTTTTSSSSTTTRPITTTAPAPAPSTNSSVTPVSVTDPIRVRLSYPLSYAGITASGSFILTDGDGTQISTLNAGEEASFVQEGIGITVKGRSYDVVRLLPAQANTIFTVNTWDRRPSWDTSGRYNDNQFRGILELRMYNGELIIINEIALEEYLYGLAEVSNGAPTEKQKAMAILARTYARFYLQPENRKFPGAPYDGHDSPDIFQKYLGYGYEQRSPNFLSAVNATKDLVVTYNGKLVKTPYFSQSDGRTRSAQEVWGWTDTPYLQSVDDPFCAGLSLQGHGVGLSGCGSEEAAKRGNTYEEIIKYYYQGVEIERL